MLLIDCLVMKLHIFEVSLMICCNVDYSFFGDVVDFVVVRDGDCNGVSGSSFLIGDGNSVGGGGLGEGNL